MTIKINGILCSKAAFERTMKAQPDGKVVVQFDDEEELVFDKKGDYVTLRGNIFQRIVATLKLLFR